MTRLFPALLVLFPCLLSAGDWPTWRGPNRDGLSTETGLPTTWSETENILWKVPLPGMAGSTPIIVNDRIYLTSEAGRDLLLLSLDTSGKELWRRKLGTGTGRKVREDEGNYSSPSPSTDGKHVFTFIGTGDFHCHDLDGNEIWTFNAQERYGRFRIQFGMHTTPVLDGDRLYLSLIHSGGAWVVAIDKATGNDVWKIARPSDGVAECEHSYASPTLYRKGDLEFLIVHGNDYATGHDLKDGRELWRVGHLNPKERYNRTLRFVSSPLATPDLIVIPTAKNGQVVGLKPTAQGEIGPGHEAEQWRIPRDTPDVPSPLLHNGLVYLCRENGTLVCLDAATGQEYYKQRIHSARYRASPVCADGKVYCVARDGTVTVVATGKEFKILATNRLNDQIAASPVIAGGRIYLRGFENLYAIGDK